MSATQRQLPGLYEVATGHEFVSPVEHLALLNWAEGQFSGGHLLANRSGPSRYYRSYKDNETVVPDLFWHVRRRAVSMFSITDYEDEPEYKCFLGCNTEGGFVQRHTDSSPPDKHHVRLNIMLSKPIGGGVPVIDGKPVQVEERDLWCFYPSVMPHESTPVTGKRKRFVLSIGILVPKSAPAEAAQN